MFSKIINLRNFNNTNEQIDYLYNCFVHDFIKKDVYLEHIYIDPKSNDKENGKEKIFWHIVTRKNRSRREFDENRACRIKWIKPIIENFRNPQIKYFYFHENSGKTRFYLWLYQKDFVVILQKLGNTSSYLVTCFYIDNQNKRDTLQRKYENYNNNTDERLNNCEWF